MNHTARLLLLFTLAFSACGGGPGDDWNSHPETPTAFSFIDVWAFSETDVWFLDGSGTIQRYDGAIFSPLETPSTEGLGCIYALSASQVWLCAGSDVLHYDGTDFELLDASDVGMSGLSGLWASSASDIWVIGEDAVVGHYDGSQWSRTITGSPFKSSIWGSGPSDVYVLDTFSFMHFDGAEWTEIELLHGGGGDGQVWGTSASDVWLISDDYLLSHYDGSQWQDIEIDLFGELVAVWGPAPDDLWAVGDFGSIAHYNGSSWSEVAQQKIGAPYLRNFGAVHGSSASDVWAVGQQLGENGSTGIIYHYDP